MYGDEYRYSGSNEHDYDQYVTSYIQTKFRGFGNFIYDSKEQRLFTLKKTFSWHSKKLEDIYPVQRTWTVRRTNNGYEAELLTFRKFQKTRWRFMFRFEGPWLRSICIFLYSAEIWRILKLYIWLYGLMIIVNIYDFLYMCYVDKLKFYVL